MHRQALDTAVGHSLEAERARFHAILDDVDRLWSAANAVPARVPSRSVAPAPPIPYRPRFGFVIVGAQKCGTTALAHFLSQHPEIGMASPKEVHLFDSPKYSDDWTPEQIDERYRSFFDHCGDVSIRGEATPIYMFLPEIARELARYNPELKLLVLLHDPVERALSHYYMEKNRARNTDRCGWPWRKNRSGCAAARMRVRTARKCVYFRIVGAGSTAFSCATSTGFSTGTGYWSCALGICEQTIMPSSVGCSPFSVCPGTCGSTPKSSSRAAGAAGGIAPCRGCSGCPIWWSSCGCVCCFAFGRDVGGARFARIGRPGNSMRMP